MARSPHLTVINSLSEVPEFATERQEAEFWDAHTMSDELWDSLPPVHTESSGPMGVSLSLNADLADRLRALAKKKGVSYLDLARRFVAERLYEEEKREGIVGDTRAS